MVTPAAVKMLTPNSAELTKDGKKLLLVVDGAENLVMKTWSTEQTTNWDAPNPGTQIVGYATTPFLFETVQEMFPK